MEFSDIADVVRRYAKTKSDTLIIIPLLQEYDFLFEHLGYLSRQTTSDFDVIIVLNRLSDESTVLKFLDGNSFNFSVIVSKRKEDTGAAGGYSTGQRYALEEGYEHMIIADSGCFPVDKHLIENLLKHKDNGYVSPSTRLVRGDEVVETLYDTTISWYSLVSARLARKHGLVFTPLYFGFEDLEYRKRIRKKAYMVDNHTHHPYFSHYYHNPDRYSAHLVNGMLFGEGVEFLVCLVSVVFYFPALLIFSPAYGRRSHEIALASLLSCTYGKPLFDRMKSGYRNYISEEIKVEDFKIMDFMHVHEKDTNAGAYIQNRFGSMLAMLRKQVLLDDATRPSIPVLVSIFSKKAFCRVQGGGYLLLADNSNIFLHAARMLLFSFYVPLLFFFLCMVYLPLKLIKKPDTRGYGLD